MQPPAKHFVPLHAKGKIYTYYILVYNNKFFNKIYEAHREKFQKIVCLPPRKTPDRYNKPEQKLLRLRHAKNMVFL